MSITLSNVVLHQLKKEGENTLAVHLREELLTHTPSSEALITDLHRVYNAKAAIGFAQFAQDSDVAAWLASFRKKEIDFLTFSSKAAERLGAELSKYPFADDGVLVFAEYRSMATEYLFIALLESKACVKVTEDLEISATDFLDIPKMDIAARIDLSTLESDPTSNRYLTYIKGRVGRKVADFFLDFMQAQIGMDTKQQNGVLMQAVEDYCADARLDPHEKQEYRRQVYDYCNGQLQAGEEVEVKALAHELPENPQGVDFYQFVTDQGYALEESFPANRAAMRQLTKFVGAGGGVSINFDGTLLGERIFYDQSTDTLTIKGVPPNLREQLKRRLNAD